MAAGAHCPSSFRRLHPSYLRPEAKMLVGTAAAIASSLALATYLDGRFSIRQDLAAIRKSRVATKAYQRLREFDLENLSSWIELCKSISLTTQTCPVKTNRLSPWLIFSEAVAKYPSHRAIWYEGRVLTYAELHDQAAQLAQWMLSAGMQPGELVGMYMTNKPEFMVIWLAALCIGYVCASKILFVDEDLECQARIELSRPAIERTGTRFIVFNGSLKQEVASSSKLVPGDEFRAHVKPEFPICLCYTSGTTGLPKGCAFTTSRTLLSGCYYAPALGVKAGPGGDCWYNCMPMYHGTGAISAIYLMLGAVSLAIGRKFSTAHFWKDICDSGSTYFIYVGEIIRYLLNAPFNQYECAHQVRCCCGNGLRPDIWEKFRKRFNVPEIAEFFSSSEGMFSMTNWNKGDFTAGFVGHQGLIQRLRYKNIYVPIKINYNIDGDIWRDPVTRFAKRMPYQIGGEIIVKVANEKDFQGYWRAEEATRKKFVRNVFRRGDLYYRTGDALRRDSEGRWSFMDRLGDTFRWKSENVSTEEVAIILASYPGIIETNVYGVLIPGHDGRAGCAALHLEYREDSFDFDALLKFVRERLPKSAVPVFLRVHSAGSAHTHNFKQNKLPLRKEGVDPAKIGTEMGLLKDKLFWVPLRQNAYVEFGSKEWERLCSGEARL